MIFGGKFGYERWDGPFVRDQPHGVGVMTFPDGSKDEDYKLAISSKVADVIEDAMSLLGIEVPQKM